MKISPFFFIEYKYKDFLFSKILTSAKAHRLQDPYDNTLLGHVIIRNYPRQQTSLMTFSLTLCCKDPSVCAYWQFFAQECLP